MAPSVVPVVPLASSRLLARYSKGSQREAHPYNRQGRGQHKNGVDQAKNRTAPQTKYKDRTTSVTASQW
jgi:hypothetical protein